MTQDNLGRIVLHDCHRPPTIVYECPLCPRWLARIAELEHAIFQHWEAWDMSKTISVDTQANNKLWGMIGK